MKKINLLFLSSVVALLFVACKDGSVDNKPAANDSSTSDNKIVEDYIRKEALNFEEEIRKGDSVALGAHYAPDALVMPPNSGTVKGTDIVSFWGSVVRSGVKDLKLNITDISGSGDVYAESGTLELFDADKKSLYTGKYVVVWKKENGNWKMYRDIWNNNMADAPTQ